MSLDTKFPREGTKEELEKLGAKHLISDPRKIDGTITTINYMLHEDPQNGLVRFWKKPIDSDIYHLHHEAIITRTYPVPLIIKPSHQL